MKKLTCRIGLIMVLSVLLNLFLEASVFCRNSEASALPPAPHCYVTVEVLLTEKDLPKTDPSRKNEFADLKVLKINSEKAALPITVGQIYKVSIAYNNSLLKGNTLKAGVSSMSTMEMELQTYFHWSDFTRLKNKGNNSGEKISHLEGQSDDVPVKVIDTKAKKSENSNSKHSE